MPLTEEQETVLLELEMILATVKQIDAHVLETTELLNKPPLDPASYNQLLLRNIHSLKTINLLLEK